MFALFISSLRVWIIWTLFLTLYFFFNPALGVRLAYIYNIIQGHHLKYEKIFPLNQQALLVKPPR